MLINTTQILKKLNLSYQVKLLRRWRAAHGAHDKMVTQNHLNCFPGMQGIYLSNKNIMNKKIINFSFIWFIFRYSFIVI